MGQKKQGRIARHSGALRSGLGRLVGAAALGVLASLSTIGHAALPATPSAMPMSTPATGPAAAPVMSAQAAAQIAALNQIKAGRSGTLKKLDSTLHLALLRRRGDAQLAAMPRLRTLKPDADGRVLVDVVIRRGGDVGAVLRKLSALRVPLVSSKRVAYDTRTVRTRLALDDLESLAGLDAVHVIRHGVEPVTSREPLTGSVSARKTRSFGPVTHALNRSEGVRTHGADDALATFGAGGAGQRICALSDGVTSLAASIASGDLPADVLVLPGQQGTGDEGTAMLEIIHDMAPAAELGFATAFGGSAAFAQNILDLAAAGCTVIVDDVLYLDESPWQDGTIAQAVNAVTAAGVSYFSSAGNEGNRNDGTSGTWEGDFQASAQPPPLPLTGMGTLHDFGDGGQSLLVEAGNRGLATFMIWAEHYTLTLGTAATDYDLYALDGALTTVLGVSNDRQDGIGGDDFPIEGIPNVNAGERLVVAQSGGPVVDRPPFNLIVFRGEVDNLLATSGTTRGHSAAAAAFSTAATPAAVPFSIVTPSGPFPELFTAVNALESFSSDGPRKILLDPDGNLLTPGNRSYASGGVVRQKPDLTAADGVSTSAPGFATFYGTSAAAPHAAAIAGLVRGAIPTISAPDLRTALTATAIDIEAPGIDRDSGAGIVMPVPALASVGATPQPLLTVASFATVQVSGDGDGAIEPGETYTIDLALTNAGAVEASGITASLQSGSPDVSIVSGTAAYPNLAAGASAGTSTLRFRVEGGLACGAPVPLTVSVAYNGTASPLVSPRNLPTGGLGAPVSFSYAGPPVAIPDAGAPVSAPVTVSGLPLGVRDVSLSIDGTACSAVAGSTTVGLDHTFVGDLVVELVGPGGDAAIAINGAGGGGANFCQTLLDERSGAPNIQTAVGSQAPFTGTWTPATSLLTALGGSGDGNGIWALRVQDLAGADVGSIRAWTLNLTSVTCDLVAPAPAVTSVVRSAGSPTNATGVGYAVTFSEAVTGVDAGDFVLTTSGTVTGTVASVSGSGSSYTVTIGSIAGNGTLRLDVADNDSIVSVGSGTPLATGFSSGEIYAIDQTVPVATTGPAGGQPDPVTAAPVRFAVTLTDLTTALDADDLILGGTAGASSVAVSGSGLAYEVAVSGMTRNGTVSLQVRAGAFTDAAGNANVASNVATANFAGFLPTVGYTLAAQSVTEGSGPGSTTVTITVTLSEASASTVTVPVTVGGASTAASPADYNLSASSFSFPAGMTVATITATIVRDTIEEANETIVLQLGAPTGAIVGTPATQIVTIGNDDDTTPAPFTFGSIAGATPGATVTSASVVVDGFNQSVPISIAGGSYSINGAAFTSAPGSLSNGQAVRVQVGASSQFSTAVSATLTVGGTSGTFSVTTVAADSTPTAFAFPAAANVEPGSVQTSEAITVGGINTASAISVTGGRYRVNGGSFTTSAGTVMAGDTVVVQQTASSAFEAASTAILNIGGVSAGYTVTTRAPDVQPDAFAFTDVGNAAVGALVSSNPITIAGIEAPVAITVSAGGSYSINGGAFTSAAGTVQAGDTVRVQVSASASNATAVSAVLTVGTGANARSDTFTVTTVAAAGGGGSAGGLLLGALGLAALWRRRRMLTD